MKSAPISFAENYFSRAHERWQENCAPKHIGPDKKAELLGQCNSLGLKVDVALARIGHLRASARREIPGLARMEGNYLSVRQDVQFVQMALSGAENCHCMRALESKLDLLCADSLQYRHETRHVQEADAAQEASRDEGFAPPPIDKTASMLGGQIAALFVVAGLAHHSLLTLAAIHDGSADLSDAIRMAQSMNAGSSSDGIIDAAAARILHEEEAAGGTPAAAHEVARVRLTRVLETAADIGQGIREQTDGGRTRVEAAYERFVGEKIRKFAAEHPEQAASAKAGAERVKRFGAHVGAARAHLGARLSRMHQTFKAGGDLDAVAEELSRMQACCVQEAEHLQGDETGARDASKQAEARLQHLKDLLAGVHDDIASVAPSVSMDEKQLRDHVIGFRVRNAPGITHLMQGIASLGGRINALWCQAQEAENEHEVPWR